MSSKEAFENGRAKALREIERRFETKLSGTITSGQPFNNQRTRSPQERLGFGNKGSEVHREQQAFQNATVAAKASDSFFIPTPADMRRMRERSREASAELHRVSIENRKAAMRRLGFGNKKSALAEQLESLLNED